MRARSVIDIAETDRDEHPRYRIDFWERPAPGYGWNSDIWLIDGAPHVSAAIAWAEAHARGRRFQLLVKTPPWTEDGGYVLLSGSNPNDPSSAEDPAAGHEGGGGS